MKNSAYARKLQSPQWQKKRLEVLNRANFTCEECGSTENQLHVHHCYYLKGAEPWECQHEADKTMLMALCEECHIERQGVEHDVKLEFSRMLSMMPTDNIRDFMVEILKGKDALKSSEAWLLICDISEHIGYHGLDIEMLKK